MKRFFHKVLKIQPEELSLFLWAAGVLFLIRSSNLVFNNFAETAFLKRFGVEYLPWVYMANSLLTFVLMGFMAGTMRRLGSGRLLSYTLVVCGLAVACLRLPVYLHFEMVYPVLFLLKAQFEVLLALLFWNLANDLFNTRQSKRLFPLITAGGVLGAILGSFGTPELARLIMMDNLLVAYLVTTCLAATAVWRLDTAFPTLPISEKRAKKGRSKTSFIQEVRQVWPLMKESTLVKILVALTFLPNLVIPIMNYQFNYAVNQAFGTEQGLIAFFGYFRGVMNIISLVILLFVGKLYSRFGLPVALMFHPVNYIIAFMAFLLRFDVLSAIYARISTVVIRQTINNPARDILMGLFPSQLRPLVRPFLRGTVVRVALLLGSGIILLSDGMVHPRFLSLVGVVAGLAWVASTWWLKRAYSDILLDLVANNVIDLRSLEEQDVGRMFSDSRSQERLVQACLQSQGQACVLYAEMLKSQNVPGADQHLLSIIRERDPRTAMELAPMVSPEAGEEAIKVFEELVDEEEPRLNAALAGAAARFPREVSGRFLRRLLEESSDPLVQARAVAGLYHEDREGFDRWIRAWLDSGRPVERRAGALAAGGSGNREWLPPLKALLTRESDRRVIGEALTALGRLEDPELRQVVLDHMHRDPRAVPREVLEDLEVTDRDTTWVFIRLLGRDDPELRELARGKLLSAPVLEIGQLIHALASPHRQVREGLYEVLSSLKVSDRDVAAFAQEELEAAYRHLLAAREVQRLETEAPEKELLVRHLTELKDGRVETLLRVLAAQDSGSQMRILLRGLASGDQRLRSNAVEALEDHLGRKLAEAMVPLLEAQPLSDALAAGRKLYDLPRRLGGEEELFAHLWEQERWVTRYLALALAARRGGPRPEPELAQRLLDSQNRHVWLLAGLFWASGGDAGGWEDKVMAEATSLSEKIVLLRGMEIFQNLTVNELAAVASLAEPRTFAPGDKIITEGEVGESMYLIISGKVGVQKRADDGCDVDLAEMGPGEYFGEMALFDNEKRSATVNAQEQTQVLVLHKQEFGEAVREYPQVALQMCKELSRRLRELHQKIQSLPVCF